MFKTENLYQNDATWKDDPLGNQTTETIGTWGCLLTSITMMLNGVGYEETPETVNDKLKKAGGFDGALLIPSVVPYLFPKVTYRTYEPCDNRPAPVAQIDTALSAGKPVIVCVDWNPKQSGVQTHWVLLKERKGDNYVMYDPYRYRGDGPDKELLLTDRYKFQGTKPEEAIHAVIWFDTVSQPSPPPEKPKVPVPADKFEVFVAEDDLAFRAESSVSGFLIGRLLAGTKLISLETKNDSLAKIGKQGQWLHVQNDKGDQGYVAAWYIAATSTPAPTTPTPKTPPTPVTTPTGALVLLPTQGDLAFRSKPLVTPETLISRLSEGEQLIVIEPAVQANQKIGVVGQWLNVKLASSGQSGYVAAWYVKPSTGGGTPAPTPVTTPEKPPEPKPDEPKPETPAPGTLIVLPTQGDLAFRSQPLVSDATLLKRLAENDQLTVIEPAATAGQKIGVVGQWLNVKDSSGQSGYVAAWYVKLPEGATAPGEGIPPGEGSKPTPLAPPSGTLKVKTTTEGVALRSQPIVNETTLITRLPDATALTVLDDNPDAKIGVMNQWLKVKDSQGNEGFIAAWYVTK